MRSSSSKIRALPKERDSRSNKGIIEMLAATCIKDLGTMGIRWSGQEGVGQRHRAKAISFVHAIASFREPKRNSTAQIREYGLIRSREKGNVGKASFRGLPNIKSTRGSVDHSLEVITLMQYESALGA